MYRSSPLGNTKLQWIKFTIVFNLQVAHVSSSKRYHSLSIVLISMWNVIVYKRKASNSPRTAGEHHLQHSVEESCTGSKQVYIWRGKNTLYRCHVNVWMHAWRNSKNIIQYLTFFYCICINKCNLAFGCFLFYCFFWTNQRILISDHTMCST